MGLAAGGAALAHTGSHPGGEWMAAFAHPFLGLDHVLAMVAVGIWAAQLGGRGRLLLPAAFVAAMAAGAAAGAHGHALPLVENVIALSVLVLGILVAAATGARWHVPLGLVALFALFHGQSHGTEMPAFSAAWLAGLTAATAVLHALGVAVGTVLKARPGILRAGGAAIGVAGGWLLFTAIA